MAAQLLSYLNDLFDTISDPNFPYFALGFLVLVAIAIYLVYLLYTNAHAGLDHIGYRKYFESQKVSELLTCVSDPDYHYPVKYQDLALQLRTDIDSIPWDQADNPKVMHQIKMINQDLSALMALVDTKGGKHVSKK